MQNNSSSKLLEIQQVKVAEKKKLRVAAYCRVNSAEQLNDASQEAEKPVQKGGEH